MRNIDLNCDMGESTTLWPYSVKHDLALLPYFSSINLACGFHAGDADTSIEIIKAAADLDISVGAHPSFPDRENFGRQNMQLEEKELYRIVYQQIEFIASIALSQGVRISHVKPHGALYNMASTNHRMAFIICSAIQAYDEDLLVYGLAGSELALVADTLGMKNCREVFADRSYGSDGKLTPRSEKNALLEDETEGMNQVLQIVKHGKLTTTTGNTIAITADTVCIHSDGNNALQFAKTIRENLENHGFRICHP